MKKKWWKQAVVYQIYPKSFQDTNGDGIGDLQGIIKRLSYLHDLGVTVLWLCPINQSPMKDNGYDISDYYKVDPSFGNNEDVGELIRSAKEYGMKVVMDLVVNHCSDQHSWFLEAMKDPESPYASYFIIEETGGEEPNNLRCYNGSSAWERMGDSNRFYFHTFSKEQPDLNWDNENLRREIIDMMKFWQEKGVAGFRIDAIGNIKKSKKVLERTCFPADGEDGMTAIDSFVLMQDGIETYLGELRDEVFDRYDMMTVAEINVPEEKLTEFIGEDGLFSMVFDFSYTDLDIEKRAGQEWQRTWTMKELKEHIFSSQKTLQKYGWGSPYLENHDQPRSVNKYLPQEEISYESKTALAGLYFFLRGTPFIYQGQELGMENYPFEEIGDMRDPFAIQRYDQTKDRGEDTEAVMNYFRARGRDNSRTPMQWDSGKYAGFSQTVPWISINPNYTQLNAQLERENEKSVFHFYKKMIYLRLRSEYSNTFTFGDFEPVETEEETCFCYKRVDEEYELVIMVNLGGKGIRVPEVCWDGDVILNNWEELDGRAEMSGREELDGRAEINDRADEEGVLMPYQVMVRAIRKNP